MRGVAYAGLHGRSLATAARQEGFVVLPDS